MGKGKSKIEVSLFTYGELEPYLDELKGLELLLEFIVDEPQQKQIEFLYNSLTRLLDDLQDSITITNLG